MMMCSVVFHFYHHTHVHVAEQGGNGQEYPTSVLAPKLELEVQLESLLESLKLWRLGGESLTE